MMRTILVYVLALFISPAISTGLQAQALSRPDHETAIHQVQNRLETIRGEKTSKDFSGTRLLAPVLLGPQVLDLPRAPLRDDVSSMERYRERVSRSIGGDSRIYGPITSLRPSKVQEVMERR